MTRITRDIDNSTVDKTVVEVLTATNARTSIYEENKEGKLIPEIIGINSVSRGEVERCMNGLWQRGFSSPENRSQMYFIDADGKTLIMRQPKEDIFMCSDKVSPKNQYTWHGSFEEFLAEFEKAGYTIR